MLFSFRQVCFLIVGAVNECEAWLLGFRGNLCRVQGPLDPAESLSHCPSRSLPPGCLGLCLLLFEVEVRTHACTASRNLGGPSEIGNRSFANHKGLYIHGHDYKCNLCFQHKAFNLSGKTGNRSSPVFVNNNFHQH